LFEADLVIVRGDEKGTMKHTNEKWPLLASLQERRFSAERREGSKMTRTAQNLTNVRARDTE
jgi:hypothetical protein